MLNLSKQIQEFVWVVELIKLLESNPESIYSLDFKETVNVISVDLCSLSNYQRYPLNFRVSKLIWIILFLNLNSYSFSLWFLYKSHMLKRQQKMSKFKLFYIIKGQYRPNCYVDNAGLKGIHLLKWSVTWNYVYSSFKV